jgi:DNA invertase Pin-like site-specific DNA recombinase
MRAKRVALYVRVSTNEQTTKNQQRELRSVATRNGWDIVKVFDDVGVSGAKGREQRPGLDALLRGVARKDFDLVAAWSVDRLGRSLQDLVQFLSELHSKRVDLYLHQQGLDTTTPAGRAMFGMLSVFAEFERAIIRERIRSGLARVRAEGKRLGRPRAHPEKEIAVRRALAAGKTFKEVAAKCGVGMSMIQRIANELRRSKPISRRAA